MANSTRDPRSEAEKAIADLKRNAEMDMSLTESPLERSKLAASFPNHRRARGSRTETARCLIPGFDGALFSLAWKDALWARYCTGAPARQRRSVERYSIVKRA